MVSFSRACEHVWSRREACITLWLLAAVSCSEALLDVLKWAFCFYWTYLWNIFSRKEFSSLLFTPRVIARGSVALGIEVFRPKRSLCPQGGPIPHPLPLNEPDVAHGSLP